MTIYDLGRVKGDPGAIQTINGINPDDKGNLTISANDVGGLAVEGTRITDNTPVTTDAIPALPFTTLCAYGKTTRSGTPTPDTPAVISSLNPGAFLLTGGNLFPGFGLAEDTTIETADGTQNYYAQAEYSEPTSDGFARFYRDNTQRTELVWCNLWTRISKIHPFIPGKKYRLLVEFRNVVSAPGAFGATSVQDGTIHFDIFNETTTVPAGEIKSGASHLFEVTTRSNMKKAYLLTRSYTSVPAGEICDFEVRLSIWPAEVTQPTYEEYHQMVCPVSFNGSLRGVAVDSGGNYTDPKGQQWICDTYDAAAGEYIQRVREHVFDGTESWESGQAGSTGRYRFRLLKQDVKAGASTDSLPALLCSHYPTATPNQTYDGTLGITVNSGIQDFIIFDPDRQQADVTAWKEYLAAQHAAGTPVTVVYELAEPVVTKNPSRFILPEGVVTAGGADITAEYNDTAGAVKVVYDTIMDTITTLHPSE